MDASEIRIRRLGPAHAGELTRIAHAVGFYERMGARRVGSVSARPTGRTLLLLRVEVGR